LREAGKIRAVGLGAETYEAVCETMTTPDLAVVQLPFGLLDPQPLDGIFDQLRHAGRQIWVRGVLGGGLVAGAMSAAPDTVRNHPKAAMIRAFDDVARRWAMPLDELAVRWACTIAPADVVLFGISSPSHLARNLELTNEQPLSAELCAEVTAIQTGRR
jgi:aryl-alcohol dehydrogenase-like predicted oxidoreductase